jgi:hypothetical protein
LLLVPRSFWPGDESENILPIAGLLLARLRPVLFGVNNGAHNRQSALVENLITDESRLLAVLERRSLEQKQKLLKVASRWCHNCI